MYPNLKLAIFKKGMQQNQVSKILGINEANLSKIIRGYREPSLSQRRMLANYLNLDETWLFERYENQARTEVFIERPADTEDAGRESS